MRAQCKDSPVELECHPDGVQAVNHRCPMDTISFDILSLDLAPPSLEVPPDVPGDEGAVMMAALFWHWGGYLTVACIALVFQGPPLEPLSRTLVLHFCELGACVFPAHL